MKKIYFGLLVVIMLVIVLLKPLSGYLTNRGNIEGNNVSTDRNDISDSINIVNDDIEVYPEEIDEEEVINEIPQIDQFQITHEELISYELYRPEITEKEALLEGYVLSETYSGREYSNSYVTYFFIDDMVTPYAMKVFKENPFEGPRLISIGTEFNEILVTLPNEHNWSIESAGDLIYGEYSNPDLPPGNLAKASFLPSGIGTMTIVTENGLPYVQVMFVDWKVDKITYYYEYLN